MTYGEYGPQQPVPPGTPQYPNGAPWPPSNAPYPQGYPQGYYPPWPSGSTPGPGHPPPPGRPSNALAVASVVFAFVFAPVGAVLGHVALGQIRRGLQRGRDLAMVGLTLSYTFIVLMVAGLALWAVTAANPGGSTLAYPTGELAVPDPAHTQTAPAQPTPDGVSGVLLSLDEVRTIMKSPRLEETPPSSESSGGDGDVKADPPECAGAVAAGLNTVYDDSGATGYARAGYSDPGTTVMINQVAASFATAAEARKFVAQSAGQWRKCTGRVFSISSSDGPGLTWELGPTVVDGDRATMQNTLTAKKDLPQSRILAAKGNVVIDLSVIARKLGTEPDTIADRMLARITG